MSQHTEFDSRMKDYENRFASSKLLNKVPAVIRLDGKGFHSYTKNMEKPFSSLLHDAFIHASIKTAEAIDGSKAVYTQSDEVSIWLDDTSNTHTMGWFDWKIQKLVSVSSSIFTYHFNEYARPHVSIPAFFDSRVFNLPNEVELNNYFVWRQADATRNSISMLAQSEFSHKSLHGLSVNDMQEKLFSEKQINWNDLDTWKKRGSLIVKVQTEQDITFVDNRTGETITKEGVKRRKWADVECPRFTSNPITTLISPM